MVQRSIIKKVWTFLSAPFWLVVGANFDRFAEAKGIDMLWSNADVTHPFWALVTDPRLVVASLVIVGITLGIWADAALKKVTSGSPDQGQRRRLLGHRLVALADQLNVVKEDPLLLTDRSFLEIKAEYGILRIALAREDIPQPPNGTPLTGNIDTNQVLNYLVSVGKALCEGDYVLAKRFAEAISNPPAAAA